MFLQYEHLNNEAKNIEIQSTATTNTEKPGKLDAASFDKFLASRKNDEEDIKRRLQQNT